MQGVGADAAAAQLLEGWGWRCSLNWPLPSLELRNIRFQPIADIRDLSQLVLMSGSEHTDRFIAPGTPVRYDGLEEGGPEYGIVISCWNDLEIGGHDCYVAFFGPGLPTGQPDEKPYILRYAASSLSVLQPSPESPLSTHCGQ